MFAIGPVFLREIRQSSRQKRLFVTRTIYGLILLGIIGWTYLSWWRYQSLDAEIDPQTMVRFASSLFRTVSMVQLCAVMLLTPAIFAGAIADEYQRKTMHDMLTSLLSGPEIVIDKMAARLLNLGVYIATSLPIVSIITLFGGVDPIEVLLTYAITISTAIMLASLSIWISTGSKTVRDAVARAYSLGMLWILSPIILGGVGYLLRHQGFGDTGWYLEEFSEWIQLSLPVVDYPWDSSGFNYAPERYAWTIGFQGCVSLILIARSAFHLRSAYANLSDGPKRKVWSRRQARIRPDLVCGEDPVYWKERNFTRLRGWTRFLLTLVWLIIVGLISWAVGMMLWDLIVSGWEPEVVSGTTVSVGTSWQFNMMIRVCSIPLFAIILLAVAARAAGSITSEREGDTWISLTATPLDGREIVQAKMRAAVLAHRPTMIVLALLWLIGLCFMVVSPIALAITCLSSYVYVKFAMALGMALSLKSSSSWKAQSQTLAVLLGLNMMLMCCVPLGNGTSWCIWISPLASIPMTLFRTSDWSWIMMGPGDPENILTVLAYPFFLGGYVLAGWVLRAYVYEHFDEVAGRARRSPRPFQSRQEPASEGEIQFVDEE